MWSRWSESCRFDIVFDFTLNLWCEAQGCLFVFLSYTTHRNFSLYLLLLLPELKAPRKKYHAPPKEKQMPLLSSCGSRKPSKYSSKDKIFSFFSWLTRMFFTPIFRPRVQNWISLILIPSFTRSNSEEPWNLQTNTELSKSLLLQPKVLRSHPEAI